MTPSAAFAVTPSTKLWNKTQAARVIHRIDHSVPPPISSLFVTTAGVSPCRTQTLLAARGSWAYSR